MEPWKKMKSLLFFYSSVVISLLLALSAPAQVKTEVEPNDTREQAQEIRVGENVEGFFQVAQDSDFFKFTLEGPGKTVIKVDLSAVPGVFVYLRLYDEQGKEIWLETGSDPLSIFNLALPRGTYFVAAWGNPANVQNKYVLAVKNVGPWKEGQEAEPNNDIAAATEIRLGQSVEGYVHFGPDSDYYKLVIDQPGKNSLQVDLSGVPSVRSMIRILGPDQKLLWETYNLSHGGPASIPYFTVTEGVYYLIVQGSPKNTAVPYVLSTRILGPWQEGQEAEPNHQKEWANPIKLDTPILGRVNNPNDVDWYILEVPPPGLDILLIQLTGISGGPNWGGFEILDARGKSRVYNLTGRQKDREEIVRMKLEPGIYTLKLQVLRGVNPGAEYTLLAGKPQKPPASPEEVQRALVKALDWLASQQQKDGSWGGPGNYFEAYTGLSLMAFIGAKCVPKDYSANIQAGLKYLKSVFVSSDKFPAGSAEAAKNGGLIGTAGPNQMYRQAIAALAVIEAMVDLDDPSLEPIAQGALDLIIRSQNTEHKPATLGGPIKPESGSCGGWRYDPTNTDSDLSVTGWQILALKAAVNAGFLVPDYVFPAAARFVRTLQGKDDGSFLYLSPGASGGSCGRAGMGALSLQLCGLPQDQAIPPAIRFMQDHAPRWNEEDPGDMHPFYYWYYGTRAMYLAGGDDWRIWKDWMCRFLVDHQSTDGSWAGTGYEEGYDAYRVALGALMLEFCCGHVPIYMSPVKRLGSGTIKVDFEKGAEKEASKNVEIIMDASNSMWGQIGGEAKIAIARKVLAQIINRLPDSMNVGMRVYGHRYGLNDPKACTDTQLLVPIGPVAKAQLIDTVNKIQLKGKTPLVLSVLEAIKDFEKIPNGSIILVTDGIESCNGDIKSIGPAVKKSGLELKVHIVGFDIKEKEARAELEAIARSTEGRYLDAKNAGELLSALEQTLKLDYVVLDEKGEEAGRGTVGGEPVKLKEGAYTLRVLLAPQPLETKVQVKAGGRTACILKKESGAWKLGC
jgi:hypothetical protein